MATIRRCLFQEKFVFFWSGENFLYGKAKKIATINLGRCKVFAFWTKVGLVFGFKAS